MKSQKMNAQTVLLSVVMAALTGVLLVGCTTTPDESYKESKMAKPLDYPPDLVAPTTNTRFSLPSPGSSPVLTPILLPETVPAPRKPTKSRGGHSH